MRKSFKHVVSIAAGAIGMYIGLWIGLGLMRISITMAKFLFGAMSTTGFLMLLVAIGWAAYNEFAKK